MSKPPPADRARRIGEFEIVRPLGRGGMGEVFEARDRAGQAVAVKVLSETSLATRERFEREVAIVTSLAHPHIVAVRFAGHDDEGAPFLAMELLRGESLDARLSRGPLAPAESVALAMQVCDALEFAHTAGVVHRDLKPENLWLCAGASLHAKVLDFGVARAAGALSLTATGEIIGTLAYMAPEQARGERDVDARADLWSLGAVLYHCLTGRAPFDADTAAGVLFQVLCTTPADVRDARPGLSASLADVVQRALRRRREERFPTAAAFRTALALADVHETARHPAPTARISNGETNRSVEYRLASVTYARGVRHGAELERLAESLAGRWVALSDDDMLVVFGEERWSGDEPVRAVRLAAAAARDAKGVGVATGRVLRGRERLAGAVINDAVRLASAGGARLDAATASSVRGIVALAQGPDGTTLLDTRPGVAPDALGTFATRFVGREVELGLLEASATEAEQRAAPATIVVRGAIGMGKSRLRHEAVSRWRGARPGGTVLHARCESYRRDEPFAALRESLALLAATDDDATKGWHAAAGEDPQRAVDRIRDAVLAAVQTLATQGPVLWAIDDAHWLDPSSAATLRWLSESATDLPLALWLFARDEATGLATWPGATSRELPPLSRSSAIELLAEVAGSAPEDVLARAAGHPLFLEELGRFWASGAGAGAPLPPSVEGVQLLQLDALAPHERETLKLASVFGGALWPDAVESLGGDASCIPALLRANVLAARARSRFPDAKEYAFRSGLMQQVAYGLWAEPERAALHARAAAWLSARDGVAAHELARHWDFAGETRRAAEAYVSAAEASSRVSDGPTTCAYAERALALTPDPALRWRALSAADTALQLDGDRALQGRVLSDLDQLAERLGPEARLEAAWRRCYFARITGDRRAAVREGLRAAKLAATANDARWGAAAHNELALALAHEGRFARARAHATRGCAQAARAGDRWLEARADGTLAFVLFEAQDDPGTALALFDAAAAGYAHVGDRRREAIALTNGGCALLRAGRTAEALERFDAAASLAQRVGNARSRAVARQNRATVLRALGDLNSARAELDFSGVEAARLGHARLAGAVAVERVYLALAANEPREALLSHAATALLAAEKTGAAVLLAAARAADLRARAAAFAMTPDALAAARGMLPTLKGMHENRAELCVALYVAGGRTERDRRAATRAIAAFVSQSAPAGLETECARGFAQRYAVPAELLPAPPDPRER